jgi:hypothetical protein
MSIWQKQLYEDSNNTSLPGRDNIAILKMEAANPFETFGFIYQTE